MSSLTRRVKTHPEIYHEAEQKQEEPKNIQPSKDVARQFLHAHPYYHCQGGCFPPSDGCFSVKFGGRMRNGSEEKQQHFGADPDEVANH